MRVFATEISIRRGTNRPAIAMTRLEDPTMTLGGGDFASRADIAVATTCDGVMSPPDIARPPATSDQQQQQQQTPHQFHLTLRVVARSANRVVGSSCPSLR
jgi:hypothetical protein